MLVSALYPVALPRQLWAVVHRTDNATGVSGGKGSASVITKFLKTFKSNFRSSTSLTDKAGMPLATFGA
jgi:hypothetical protein